MWAQCGPHNASPLLVVCPEKTAIRFDILEHYQTVQLQPQHAAGVFQPRILVSVRDYVTGPRTNGFGRGRRRCLESACKTYSTVMEFFCCQIMFLIETNFFSLVTPFSYAHRFCIVHCWLGILNLCTTSWRQSASTELLSWVDAVVQLDQQTSTNYMQHYYICNEQNERWKQHLRFVAMKVWQRKKYNQKLRRK